MTQLNANNAPMFLMCLILSHLIILLVAGTVQYLHEDLLISVLAGFNYRDSIKSGKVAENDAVTL